MTIKKLLVFCLLTSTFLFLIAKDIAFALPSDYSVESGDVSSSNPDPTTLVITASDHAIINFDSFSIGQNETVQFVQPFDSASVLSRLLRLFTSSRRMMILWTSAKS